MNHIHNTVVDTAAYSSSKFDAMAVLAHHGKSFHFAGKFLPEKQMHDCARLYSFCRYIDDIADLSSNNDIAKDRLNSISLDLQKGQSVDLRVQDFIQLADEKNISESIVNELLLGLKQDLDAVFFETESQLKRYCYRVAGTVGLMMCSVLGVEDTAAYPFAIDLGIAMQLTNISRDVYEDALADRCYVPAEWMEISASNEIIDANKAQQQVFKSAVARLLIEAENYYQSAEQGLVYLPFRARLAIAIAARVYRGIGKKIKKMDYAVWENRAYVKKTGKVSIAAATLSKFFVQKKYHTALFSHNPVLHKHLGQLPACNVWLERNH